MWVLSIRGREAIRRDHLVPQEELFVFPIQHDGLHDQIERLPDQVADVRAFGASVWRDTQPGNLVDGEPHLRVAQSLQDVFSGLLELVDCLRFLGIKMLVLSPHDRMNLFADPEVMPQFIHESLQRLGRRCRTHDRFGSNRRQFGF
jgi:hypothetical protein